MPANGKSSPEQGELLLFSQPGDPPVHSLEDRAELMKKHVTGRAAFTRFMFPGQFGIDEVELAETSIPEEAYRESSAAAIRGHVYERSPQSMRQFQRTGRWVLLTAHEFDQVINFPQEYANGGDIKNRTTLRAQFRDYSERIDTATRAGAHTLERPYKVMTAMIDLYANEIDDLRSVQKAIKHHWQANSVPYKLRNAVFSARDTMRTTLEAIASVKGWSEDDLAQVQQGLDKRLLSGRGQQELMRKKDEWNAHIRTLGNYTIAKKRLVRDRAERAKAEIDTRLNPEVKE